MSWHLRAAAALVAAGLAVGSSARAGDLFQLALPARDTPAQTLALQGDADTMTVGWRGHSHGGYRGHAYYRPYSRGYAYYRYPSRYYPRYGYSFSFGYNYAPPAYYYAPPPACYYPPTYYYPMGLAGETYSLPGGEVTYSVTRPAAPGPEQVPMPSPRDGNFRYDGGPDNLVPMPKGDAGPASSPRYFHIAPMDEIKVSLPAETKPAKGKFAYPAYGEEPRRADSARDGAVVVKEPKKTGR